MQQTVLWIFVCSCFLARCAATFDNDTLEGPNVCTRQEPYNVTIKVASKKPRQIKSYTWCAKIPPRCSKNEIQFDTVSKDEVVTKTRQIYVCCEGYALSSRRCMPICTLDCIHGTCIEPNKCKCEPGYSGPECSICYRGKNCGEPCPVGDNCDGLMTAKRVPKVRKQESGGAESIVGGIFLVILFATILVLVVLYYRRRVQSLKTQICNIHYTADPEASDKNNFDNRVYSFGSTIRDVKNSNLDKEKKECYGVDPGFLNGSPGNSILLKNKEVVYAIPYVYHTEDNSLDKNEHVYEEIKDSARNLQAHYHQILNGIKKHGEQSSDNSSSKTGGY